MISALILSAALAAPAAPASATQRLSEARKLVDELQYDKAVKVIEAALGQSGMERATLIALYELAGISYATLDKPAKAKEAFQQLLSLAPDFQLSKDLPPRTRTPFFEAKTWLSETTPVSVAVKSTFENGRLSGLAITVTDNTLVVAKAVRVTITPPGGQPETATLVLEGKQASTPLGENGAAWTIEAINDRGVLASASGEARPAAPAPVVMKTAAPASAGLSWQATTGILLGVAGVVTLIGASAAGLASSSARTRITQAERSPTGVVVGLTQREAAQLDASARSTALVANVLFITGGVLAASGLAFFIFGSPSEPAPTVSVAFSPMGALVSGAF